MKKIIVLLAFVLAGASCKDKDLSTGKVTQDSIDEMSVENNSMESKAVPPPSMVYKSCGSIAISGIGKTASVQTHLPKLSAANYKYVKYYNISNGSTYGVLGVLTTTNYNTNLRLRNEPIELQAPANATIDLNALRSYRGGRDFKNLKIGDDVYFVCFHDSRFDENIDTVLNYYQDNLPNIIDIDSPISDKKINDEPKVGNGGILSATGCQ